MAGLVPANLRPQEMNAVDTASLDPVTVHYVNGGNLTTLRLIGQRCPAIPPVTGGHRIALGGWW
jgi:hypothetical protein